MRSRKKVILLLFTFLIVFSVSVAFLSRNHTAKADYPDEYGMLETGCHAIEMDSSTTVYQSGMEVDQYVYGYYGIPKSVYADSSYCGEIFAKAVVINSSNVSSIKDIEVGVYVNDQGPESSPVSPTSGAITLYSPLYTTWPGDEICVRTFFNDVSFDASHPGFATNSNCKIASPRVSGLYQENT